MVTPCLLVQSDSAVPLLASHRVSREQCLGEGEPGGLFSTYFGTGSGIWYILVEGVGSGYIFSLRGTSVDKPHHQLHFLFPTLFLKITTVTQVPAQQARAGELCAASLLPHRQHCWSVSSCRGLLAVCSLLKSQRFIAASEVIAWPVELLLQEMHENKRPPILRFRSQI